MRAHENETKNKNFMAENEFEKTLHKNLGFVATEQYKLIRANLDFTLPENEKCYIIGITSSISGEGKSTTAINLAYVLAEKGSKVLLIDGDLRLPSIAKKLDINYIKTDIDNVCNQYCSERQCRNTISPYEIRQAHHIT